MVQSAAFCRADPVAPSAEKADACLLLGRLRLDAGDTLDQRLTGGS
jgi:hypothetical protein